LRIVLTKFFIDPSYDRMAFPQHFIKNYYPQYGESSSQYA